MDRGPFDESILSSSLVFLGGGGKGRAGGERVGRLMSSFSTLIFSCSDPFYLDTVSLLS